MNSLYQEENIFLTGNWEPRNEPIETNQLK